MRTYEAIFILDSRNLDDGGEEFSREVEKHIRSLGGRVRQRSALGRRQFARPIGKRKAGVYLNFVFDVGEDQVSVLNDKYRLNNVVLRLQVFHHQPQAAPEKTDSSS